MLASSLAAVGAALGAHWISMAWAFLMALAFAAMAWGRRKEMTPYAAQKYLNALAEEES